MCLKREALYARVSTDKQEREETVASQVDLLHQTAEAHGYEVLPGSVFIDDGISGARLDRPALDRLRDLVAEGVFEVILVTVPARLARWWRSSSGWAQRHNTQRHCQMSLPTCPTPRLHGILAACTRDHPPPCIGAIGFRRS